jgi:hypothetical protein
VVSKPRTCAGGNRFARLEVHIYLCHLSYLVHYPQHTFVSFSKTRTSVYMSLRDAFVQNRHQRHRCVDMTAFSSMWILSDSLENLKVKGKPCDEGAPRLLAEFEVKCKQRSTVSWPYKPKLLNRFPPLQ